MIALLIALAGEPSIVTQDGCYFLTERMVRIIEARQEGQDKSTARQEARAPEMQAVLDRALEAVYAAQTPAEAHLWVEQESRRCLAGIFN